MRLGEVRRGFERAPARVLRMSDADLPGVEPLRETGVHGREAGPRRTVTCVELDGTGEHLAAPVQPTPHHARELLASLQVAIVCLLTVALGGLEGRCGSLGGGGAPRLPERSGVETFRA